MGKKDNRRTPKMNRKRRQEKLKDRIRAKKEAAKKKK